MVKESVFTFPVTTGSYQAFIEEIFALSEKKASSYVCFANVHMVVEAYRDAAFNSVVKHADIVTPDGKPVALFLRLLKGINQVRVCGLDVFPDLLREAEARGKSIYFYGTTDDILSKMKEKAHQEFPSLNISGSYSPPFRTLSEEEKEDIIKIINDTNPDLVCVALGCPKQENWMASHKGKINGCMLGLGHAFNVYAGEAKRSPKWMQQLSLEWAYRLYQEPGRLWKRYFYTNSLFLLLTLKYYLSSLFSGNKKTKSKAIYKCEYNVVWIPMLEFPSLSGDIHDTIHRSIRALCEQRGANVIDTNIHANYIQLRVSVPPKISVSELIEFLKDSLAAKLFRSHPTLKNSVSRNTLWKNGFFVTTDALNENLIMRYVEHNGGRN